MGIRLIIHYQLICRTFCSNRHNFRFGKPNKVANDLPIGGLVLFLGMSKI